MGPLVLFVSVACDVRRTELEARANDARARVASTHVYFAEHAKAICGEMAEAETPIIPPLSKKCARGCTCASASTEDNSSVYDCEQWKAPEWKLIHFAGRFTEKGTPPEKVYFHHRARWRRGDQNCRLELTLFGDLDEDGVYSTYETWVEPTANAYHAELPDAAVLRK